MVRGPTYKAAFSFMTLRLMILAASLAACHGKSKDAEVRAQRIAAAAAVEGLDTIPADVHVVVGLNVARLAQSPLVRRKVLDLLARSPEAKRLLEGLLSRCAIDPARDVETVLLALGDRPDEVGGGDRKSTRLNSSHIQKSRMPSSA